MNYLLTGGSGRLGQELQKYLDCYAPSKEELDVTDKIKSFSFVDAIIHAAADTDVVGAETERERCFKVNVRGTKNLLDAYPNKRFIYISSEYAHNPVNFYGWTKLWAEKLVEQHPNHLIIRTSFLSKPFMHYKAFFDSYTQGDYIDIIAPMIAAEILRDINGKVYVGTGRKTVYDLARMTKPNIEAISVDDIKTVKIPHDYQ